MVVHAGLFDGRGWSARLAWLLTGVLAALSIHHGLAGSYRWFLFSGFAVLLVVMPAIDRREAMAIPPWGLVALVVLPTLDAAWAGESALTTVGTYVAVAAVALVAAVELDRFTAVRLTDAFAIVLVVLVTLAVAAGWNVALWLSDVTLSTDYVIGERSQDAANDALMVEFGLAAIAGLVAGVGFNRFFRDADDEADGAGMTVDHDGDVATGDVANGDVANGDGAASGNRQTADSSGTTGHDGTAGGDAATGRAPEIEAESSVAPSFVRRRLDLPEETVRRLSRALQVALGVVGLYGLVTLDVTTIVNAGVALAITFLPTVLRRERRVPLEPELVFWLTAAVFLHTLGSAGLYDLIGPLDRLAHTLSASVVAAAGYAGVRAIDLHTERIYLPPRLLFVLLVVFVLAFGVVWELLEFGIDQSAQRLGLEAVLAQHGIDDTIGDLVFNALGAVAVGTWGSIYLTDLSRRLADELGE